MPSWSDMLYKADISTASSGDNTIVTGVAGKRIAIDFLVVRSESATTTIQMKDGTTNYGGSHALDRHEAFVLENTMLNHDGVITLTAGNSFVLNNSAAVQVSGFVRYRMLDNS